MDVDPSGGWALILATAVLFLVFWGLYRLAVWFLAKLVRDVLARLDRD